MIQNYSDLVTKMGQFLKRQDLVPLLPDFIMLAEMYFDKTIYTKARRSSFVQTPSAMTVALPNDCKRVVRAYWAGKPLDFYPNDYQSAYANGSSDQIGQGYQINGDTLALTVPQLGQVLQVDYYQTLEPLSTANVSNWLLLCGPEIYLYGALHEAATYTRDDTRMQLWQQKRDAAIQVLVDDDKRSRTPEQSIVMRRG